MPEDLERLRERLEESIDSLGWWMIAFTGVVVIGLIIELQIPFLDFFRTRNVGVFVDSIGALLVAAGIAGEFYIEFRAHRRENRLRSINAVIDAESTNRLKAADERIAEAQKRAAEADERAAKAQRAAAEANLAMELERIERIKLEKKFAWRRLTLEQQLRIKSKLTGVPPGQKFFIFVSPEPESMQLMNTIRDLMVSSGWVLQPPSGPISLGIMFTPWIGEGLHIHFAPSRVANLGPIATVVAGAINAEGIGINIAMNHELDNTPDAMFLLVGSKQQTPDPPQATGPQATPVGFPQ